MHTPRMLLGYEQDQPDPVGIDYPLVMALAKERHEWTLGHLITWGLIGACLLGVVALGTVHVWGPWVGWW